MRGGKATPTQSLDLQLLPPKPFLFIRSCPASQATLTPMVAGRGRGAKTTRAARSSKKGKKHASAPSASPSPAPSHGKRKGDSKAPTVAKQPDPKKLKKNSGAAIGSGKVVCCSSSCVRFDLVSQEYTVV